MNFTVENLADEEGTFEGTTFFRLRSAFSHGCQTTGEHATPTRPELSEVARGPCSHVSSTRNGKWSRSCTSKDVSAALSHKTSMILHTRITVHKMSLKPSSVQNCLKIDGIKNGSFPNSKEVIRA